MAPFSKQKQHRPVDNVVYTDKDALILIMGPSGSGKSTVQSPHQTLLIATWGQFVNRYLGREAALVTHSYNSCTTAIQPYCSPCPVESPHSPKHQIVLIDTPGLFGGDLNELETLEQISTWLRPKDGFVHISSVFDGYRTLARFRPERRLSGIAYLHDMTQKRLRRETKLSLDLFRKICDGQSIERGRGLDGEFFKSMTNAGARCMDIKDEVTERSVIEYILTNAVAQDIILELQKELQIKGATLANTAAGKELKACLLEVLCHTDPRSQKQQVAVINRTIKELNTNPSLSQRFKTDDLSHPCLH
ncbi:hypothetical protein BKA70DRAFT_1447782 [Coprinopsis sp. MPI-PUGE-AT-0042]|nr:hypothetical protein BKA70DRAFT_1447782 [Coprinopsis sp. MPI-PUGE-AT-0042]